MELLIYYFLINGFFFKISILLKDVSRSRQTLYSIGPISVATTLVATLLLHYSRFIIIIFSNISN